MTEPAPTTETRDDAKTGSPAEEATAEESKQEPSKPVIEISELDALKVENNLLKFEKLALGVDEARRAFKDHQHHMRAHIDEMSATYGVDMKNYEVRGQQAVLVDPRKNVSRVPPVPMPKR